MYESSSCIKKSVSLRSTKALISKICFEIKTRIKLDLNMSWE